MSTPVREPEALTGLTSEEVFHEGETAVQERAGVRAAAVKLGPRVVQSRLDPEFAAFLRHQPFVIVASATPSGRVWASILVGQPGFASATGPDRVIVRSEIALIDPLTEALEHGPSAVGLLVIEPVTRSRIRINGIARRTSSGFELDVNEAFGNCTKYIQRRVPVGLAAGTAETATRIGNHLEADQILLIDSADTFFIASRHPERGADASHRGGRPGFVKVDQAGGVLTFPDYPGNNMFQTLGNLVVNPEAGLLFIDWDNGRTLQITGRADVSWNERRLSTWPGAQRLVDVHLDAVIDRSDGSALQWQFVEAHRLNPSVPPPETRGPAAPGSNPQHDERTT
jgi:predicted pyridoxine 5'-phosphate oxidase superfamily flavin-nucleotide-binding protein